ncbi:MAG: glycosyltransferase family 2 protein [Coriobacteriaceae bacterium]|nr:glycosyltransferase family 2 protein [Coriobacteriaceae bacterium]
MGSRVLAIIPAYNEEECIVDTVSELRATVPDVDFLVVNDGSSDATADLCRQHGYPLLDLPINGGLAVGFQAGMKYANRAGYDYAIQFDADGQHEPVYIPSLVDRAIQSSADIVIASRFLSEPKGTSARMLGSRVITAIIELTTGKRINDPTSGMRLFNRAMIHRFAVDDRANPEPETLALLIHEGKRVEEVQVTMRERQGGESYLTLSRSMSYMLRACFSILFVRWFR